MSGHRWALIAGSAGLVGGLALGVTGFANAAGTTPTPTQSPKAGGGQGPGSGHGFRPGGPGGPGKGFRGGPGGGFQGRAGGGFGGPGGFGGGLVTKVDGSSVSVQTPGGVKTYALNSSTTYSEGRTKATKSDVKVGEIVFVRVSDPKATSPVASSVTVVPAHLAGYVTSTSGGTITIKDESGFTRTIRTTSSTTYEKDGAAGTASDITVGALVRATGEVDADGTTLDATKVIVGHPRAQPRTRPSGAPSGAPGAQPGSDDAPQGPGEDPGSA